MPGMNSGLSPSNSILVAAFRSALLHQGLLVVGVFVLLSVVWGAARDWQAPPGPVRVKAAEPAGRWVLRAGFGLLWLLDGILQAQPQMAGGLPSQVTVPAAQGSPDWVQHLVNWAGTIWTDHPVQAAAASVWVQAGIGLWLLTAPRGWWSRAAGLAAVAWGLVVWVFGEAFGGIFAPGLSWMFGAPGAALLYVAAGALTALPPRAWQSPLPGRLLLAGTGVFWAGMAVLQAWPGHGFWQDGGNGPVASMAQQMSGSPQPHPLSALVATFGTFAAAHGIAVNLVMVAALAAIGAALCSRQPAIAKSAVIAGSVLCAADWVLVQDFGFWGGLGTDPNSMPPMIVLLWGGYLAVTRPVPAIDITEAAAPERTPMPLTVRRRLARPAAIRASLAGASAATITAAGALGMVLTGAVPMAAASVNMNADPVIAQAIAGDSPPVDLPAPEFSLVNQNGRPVTLTMLRGKVVLLTFLDPVCVSDCPLIAQELRRAGQILGSDASRVDLVAIALNPLFYSPPYIRAFDEQENLTGVPDWQYLTGPLPQLRKIWNSYGVAADVSAGGAMVAHSDIAIVIDRDGHIRQEIDADPGPGTASTRSSFAALLAGAARQALGMR